MVIISSYWFLLLANLLPLIIAAIVLCRLRSKNKSSISNKSAPVSQLILMLTPGVVPAVLYLIQQIVFCGRIKMSDGGMGVMGGNLMFVLFVCTVVLIAIGNLFVIGGKSFWLELLAIPLGLIIFAFSIAIVAFAVIFIQICGPVYL